MKIDARVLLVMPRNRRSTLLEALEEGATHVLTASDCAEAESFLRSRRPFQVVVTDACLSDGDWRRVLEATGACHNTKVVVCAPSMNACMANEVFSRGADLLFEPFDKEDVLRTVESAVNAVHVRAWAFPQALPAGSVL